MPLNSAFPALLVPAFCRAFARFSRRPEGSRGLSLLQPCCGLSVADGRAPISHTLEGFEGLQPQAGLVQTSVPVVCCIMSKNYFSESPGRSPDLLSRLRPQPVPLWAFLNFRGQRYSEYLILSNILRKIFKQIFKLSFKTLKIK